MRSYTSRPGEPVPFALDDVVFTAPGGVVLLDLVELARAGDIDVTSPAGVAVVGDFFESMLGPDEYQRFRVHTREHRTDPDTLMQIMGDLVQELTGAPLPLPSPSAPGPTATPSTYRVVTSLGVSEQALTPEREAQLAEAVRQAAGSKSP